MSARIVLLLLLQIACIIPVSHGSVITNATTVTYSNRSPNVFRCNVRVPNGCTSQQGCQCYVDVECRKVIECLGGLAELPLSGVDRDTAVINITAPVDRPNNLKLGSSFADYVNLTEVHITNSQVKAIGEHTFCPWICTPFECDLPILKLNFSSNSLSKLNSPDEFECLAKLAILDLSKNQLKNTLSSGIFSKLVSLEFLSLASNGIVELAPTLFMNLNLLKSLDLSDNYIQKIEDHTLHHIVHLKVLNLARNNIAQIDHETLKGLEKLEELDLSHNKLRTLSPQTFNAMSSLRVLRLNNNRLANMANTKNVFKGLRLDLLDLSNNHINPFDVCTFCGLERLKHLNLANNHLNSLNENLLKDVGGSVEELYLDNNTHLVDALSSVYSILQPLRSLKTLSLTHLKLNDKLPQSVFEHNKLLKRLNLSHNSLNELSSAMLAPLTGLSVLDVSHNEISFIDPATFQLLDNLYLTHIYLHDNPFSCYRCHILPFIDWLSKNPPAYMKACPQHTRDHLSRQHCAVCLTPTMLHGRFLDDQELVNDLEFCTNPEVQLRVSASEPQVGLILAFLIILSLIAIIIVVIAVYRKHGAVYYTQEDKLSSNDKIYAGSMGSPELGNVRHHSQFAHNHAGRSMTSTNFTLSRQGTMFSPQSSLEHQQSAAAQPLSPPGVPDSNHSGGNAHHQGAAREYACDSCVNSPQVKQVLASLPAMAEMIENRVASSMANDGAAAVTILTATVANNRASNGSVGDACAAVPTIPKMMMANGNGNNNQPRVALLNEIKLEFDDEKSGDHEDGDKVHIYI